MTPRSPCSASVGCRKMVGILSELRVATSLLPMWPLLPTPQIMIFPVQRVMAETAEEKPVRAWGSVS